MVALLVVFTILLALVVDSVLLAARSTAEASVAAPAGPMPVPTPPEGIYLDGGHAWVQPAGNGGFRVGLDDFLTGALGSPARVSVPEAGTEVRRGEPLVTLEFGGRTLAVPAPVSGTVRAANARVLGEPGLVARDPYGAGWVVSLLSREPLEALRPLRFAGAAREFLVAELEKLADFLAFEATPAAVPVMADGGVPARGSVLALDDAAFERFADKFLTQEEGR